MNKFLLKRDPTVPTTFASSCGSVSPHLATAVHVTLECHRQTPKTRQLVQQHDAAPYPLMLARQEQPKPDHNKKEGEPTFCLLFSKVHHGPGLVRDCDRGDV